MSDETQDERAVLATWRANAAPWVGAVRRGTIPSRIETTNAAMVDAVASRTPVTVLDVGCGEGWLARALQARGIRVTGIDAVPELVDAARQEGGAEFRVMSYEELATGGLAGPFDTVACNFSLIGKEGTESVVRASARLLERGGWLVIQTLHPAFARGDGPYEDGWRSGSWLGCGPDFSDPAPWYFRTFGGWLRLLDAYGFRVQEVREPLRPENGEPASAIFMARREGA